MNILDWVIIGLAAIALIVGAIKGLIKQLFTIIGVVTVAPLTALVSPYVSNLLAGLISNESTCALVAMIVSVVLIIVVYTILALLIQRLFKKVKVLKAVNIIFGAILGVAAIYFVMAVLIAIINNTGDNFLPTVKGWVGEYFQNSWIVNNIYQNNFFGDWVVNDIAMKLLG